MSGITISSRMNDGEKVLFYTYHCIYCGIDVPENFPMVNIGDSDVACCDCAFINGDISEEQYVKYACYWASAGNCCAEIIDGEIIISSKKRSKVRKDKRNSPKYNHWRKLVYARDDYTCQKCGKIGGKINAHHKKPYSTHKELRLDIDNGITLCYCCHRIAHGSH